jgi:gluconate 5-dehydrogenase
MSDSLFSVRDQIVLVSGGSRGIGKAIAAGFSERGAHVIVTGRDARTLTDAAKEIARDRPVEPIVCDVASTGGIQRLVKQVMAEHGRIDTLVNVAGVNRRKPALDVTEDDFDFVTDINLKGAFLLSQAVGRHMVMRRAGSQVNIASLNTDRPLRNVLPYAMSKAALGQMTRGLAMEWGSKGVRVNAIAPGFVLTDLTQKLWADETMAAWGRANIPQGRLGTPEELVGAAIFLASPAAAYVTGQILYVDGGFTAGWSWPIPADGGQ